MTYDKIIELLKSNKLDSTAESFESAIEDEASALQNGTTRYDRMKKFGASSYPSPGTIEVAKEFYAEDITNQLADPVEPTPVRMMTLRRFPVTWAVAETLRIAMQTTRNNESVAMDCEDGHNFGPQGRCTRCVKYR